MPLRIEIGDITKYKVDAVVNAANRTLLGGGGVDGAIHRAAGPGLLAECKTLGGCQTGEAKITGGHKLPAKYVIHTVGPVWHGGNNAEEQELRNCYINSVKLAKQKGLTSVAFPLISSGAYGYPAKEAFTVACTAISEALDGDDMDAILVLFNKMYFAPHIDFKKPESKIRFSESRDIYAEASFNSDFSVCESLSDECLEDASDDSDFSVCESLSDECLEDAPDDSYFSYGMPPRESKEEKSPMLGMMVPKKKGFHISISEKGMSLPDLFRNVKDETFSDMLFSLIDEKKMTDAECYKKANVSRKLFSKIRCDKNYHPEKKTVLCFAIALELDEKQTRELLMKAGYAFSDSSRFDCIILYFINNGIYDIFYLNETLLEYDQMLLF